MTDLISTNPARNEEQIGRVTVSTDDDIKKAVDKARAAFSTWSELSLDERLEYFKRLQLLVEKAADELAKLESVEMGKPIRESLKSVQGNARRIGLHVERAPELLAPRTVGATDMGETELRREPYGVVAAIMPWNFPTSNFFIPALPALISGNTFVVKLSEECPLVSKRIAELVAEAGFPDGVCSVLYGGAEVGAALLKQDIDFVYFTGSTKTGRAIFEKAAVKFIPSVLEMGGSSPGIIAEDADIDVAAANAYTQRFWNCGQVCTALKRLIVHESIFDVVVERMKALAAAEKIGDPTDPATTIGPLVAERQVKVLEEQVADAIVKGGIIVCGGKRAAGLTGAFYEPTIITNVRPDMRIMREEVFGPVLPIATFRTDEEAIRIANDTEYGLSAYIYTSDTKRAERLVAGVQAGEVHVNGTSKDSRAPIGGYKHSGMGRADGDYGYFAMTQLKTIARPQEL